MARGDIHWFNAALLALGQEIHDLPNDSLQLGIITNANAPALNTSNPTFGNGGTNFALDQVQANGSAYTGPVTLASKTWTQVSNIPTLAANSISIAQDVASGFANGYWAILFNNTPAGKNALAYVDLGGPVGNQNGPLQINWNASAVSGPILTASAS